MNRISILLILACPLIAEAQTWNETMIINSPQIIYNHKFGADIEIDGHLGIIKAEDYAYFLKLDGSQWTITQTVASSGVSYPYSGHPISISGSRAIASLNHNVVIYELDESSNSWLAIDTLKPTSIYHEFGYAISINEDLIAIGSPKEGVNEYGEGTVSIYQNIDGSWNFVQKITATDTTRSSAFGKSVVIEGSNLYVGAPYKDDSFGAVYHFTQSASTNKWEQTSKITPPIRSDEQFGFDIDAYGNRLLVDGLEDSTYLFKYDNSVWSVEKSFGGESSSSKAITAIAIDENRMLLSKSNTDGHVEVYTLGSNNEWDETFKMYGSNQEYNDDFGVSVALSGNNAMVGTSNKDTNQGRRLGVVYSFEATNSPYAFEESDWFSPTIAGRLPQFIDYDNDGDVDLFISVSGSNNESRLFLNTGSSFENTSHIFPYIDTDGFAKWTHMNHDELPDLLIYSQYGNPSFRLFINKGETFMEEEIAFPRFDTYSPYGFHFADYDKDGDSDILIQGYNEYPFEMKILENSGNYKFQDSGISFDGIFKSQNPWGDFNNDGWLDILAFEENDCNDGNIVIYKNKGNGEFGKITRYHNQALNDDLLNRSGTAEWFDFDNDADLDIVIAGQYSCNTGDGDSFVMINEGEETFQPLNPPFLTFGDYTNSVDIETGDFNNDGRNDIFIYGEKDGLNSTNLWLNEKDDMSFFQIRDILNSSWTGSMDAADFDRDGDVDIVIAGEKTYSNQSVKIYRNNSNEGWSVLNTAPSSPTNLMTKFNGNNVTFSWDESIDDSTPNIALKYNISLTRNDSTILHENYLGERYSLLNKSSMTLNNLPNGNYKWTVRAIDNSNSASEFAEHNEFYLGDDPMLSAKNNFLLKIYPNPVTEIISIEQFNYENLNFSLIDINGREMAVDSSYSQSEIILNVISLPRGTYFLRVWNKSYFFTKKVVLQ